MQKIIISKLPKDSRVLLEAKDGCCELLVTTPASSIVQVNSARAPANAVGQAMNDIEHGETFAIRFKNGTWVFERVISATVYGMVGITTSFNAKGPGCASKAR